jgi:hypothetical protein
MKMEMRVAARGARLRGGTVSAFSYFSFRSSVARRRRKNSWTEGQTRSRKSPEPVRVVRNLTRTYTRREGQVRYWFLRRRRVFRVLRYC